MDKHHFSMHCFGSKFWSQRQAGLLVEGARTHPYTLLPPELADKF